MGILDSILGSVMGSSNAASSPVGGILGSLLGGGGGGGGAGGMLGNMLGGGQQQQGGALGGLLQKFQQAGMGNVANSWVSNGPNQQVSPDQLQQVFGQQQVNQWAQQSNMQPHDLLSQLSQYLPHAVDHMTPNGQMPEGDAFSGAGVNMGSGGGSQAASGDDPFSGSGTNLGSRRG
jgi:uncharacterized protein YidB (DUF937 family)